MSDTYKVKLFEKVLNKFEQKVIDGKVLTILREDGSQTPITELYNFIIDGLKAIPSDAELEAQGTIMYGERAN